MKSVPGNGIPVLYSITTESARKMYTHFRRGKIFSFSVIAIYSVLSHFDKTLKEVYIFIGVLLQIEYLYRFFLS